MTTAITDLFTANHIASKHQSGEVALERLSTSIDSRYIFYAHVTLLRCCVRAFDCKTRSICNYEVHNVHKLARVWFQFEYAAEKLLM